ncbi:hypothetical protein FD02_GL002011 [Lacticaseibacillus nasuensis JCM 17158]|jgi:hypothetical protein|uniref:DUF4828 domain-containing protein n=1 Tax=Lacticaseibacillus nasuensis JCM 17158 TaxID=1291734 RepID=A0A0R1JK27_9LACO|nr:DUF4828 domain-containing protein [Lacticaseibacillus nasuensis]KRK71766.1 hypothetical protein FD02_GL002011 [Lacticaseibacillus nasuensis JCM 17158]MCX2455499.1 DUF4828 domain-containing protein [Lacticaseibacillus nasuensis]
MPKRLTNFLANLTKHVAHRPHDLPAEHNPAVALAHAYTGDYVFLDEQTNKSHQLSISPDLAIKIDGRTLPGNVTGITVTSLTFLDHYGYQLSVTNGPTGPVAVYDEAEDQTYEIVQPDHQLNDD